MPNVRLILEYHGAGFCGWQKQNNGRTIQAELEKAIEIILRCKISPLHASGRTDSGVHAKAQVVTFKTEESFDLDRLKLGVNHLLKTEVAILSAEFVPDSFYPGRDVISKQYTYTILNRLAPAVLDKGQVWHIGQNLNVEIMQKEASALIGELDFAGFQGANCAAKTTIKTIFESEVSRIGDYVKYRVVGTGFLKQMVRNIVGTLVQHGLGNPDMKPISQILESKDRRMAGPTAPPYGLCLDWVRYKPS